MIVIKDAMVLIHLAKITVLEKCCSFFSQVLIPELVLTEIMKGKDKGHADVHVIETLIKSEKIKVKKVKDSDIIKNLNNFNIQKGEAEVIALYWQEKAELIATDDDNVRKKKTVLNLRMIGTPSILLQLYKKKIISKQKIHDCITELRKIAWFSNSVLDKMVMEVEND